jgi:PKD repeat protein
MRKLLLASLLVTSLGCQNKTPSGPGVVTITETTTSTSTSTTTTSTIPLATVAAFTFSPVTPEILQLVNFNASTSTPGTGRTIVRYNWDFGDGVTKPNGGVTNVHDYEKVGIYLVTLTVVDDLGRPTSTSQSITVRPIIP